MSTANDNYERLMRVGLIHSEPLPDELMEVINGLTEDQVSVIETVGRNLEEAAQSVDLPPEPLVSELKFVNWMVF